MKHGNPNEDLRCSKENFPNLISQEVKILDNILLLVKRFDVLLGEEDSEMVQEIKAILDQFEIKNTNMAGGMLNAAILDQIFSCFSSLHHFISCHKEELEETDLIKATSAMATASTCLIKAVTSITLNVTE